MYKARFTNRCTRIRIRILRHIRILRRTPTICMRIHMPNHIHTRLHSTLTLCRNTRTLILINTRTHTPHNSFNP